eukprot:scaffold1026_cov409-Prasinococcus_capsulatus_cf.AAC.20
MHNREHARWRVCHDVDAFITRGLRGRKGLGSCQLTCLALGKGVRVCIHVSDTAETFRWPPRRESEGARLAACMVGPSYFDGPVTLKATGAWRHCPACEACLTASVAG